MELRTVPNPQRGCGQLKEGGFYARGDVGTGGTLSSWTWTLGEHVIGGKNLNISVPARQMQVINLPATLHRRQMSTEAVELFADNPLAKLPAYALLDHIGSEYYTPWSFMLECSQHGPSRRIPQNIANAIAKHCPIPIVFTHTWLPVVDEHYWADLCQWTAPGVAPALWTTEPTYEVTEWGIRRDDWHGGLDRNGLIHWIIPTLRQMHEAGGGKEKHLSQIMPAELAENTLLSEQIYGISWITRCVYIASENDNDQTLEELMQAGIEPVRAAAESDDEDTSHDLD